MQHALAVSDGKAGEDWQGRLDHVVQTMREMSQQTDPQAMVRAYGARVRQILPTDRMVALSRRDLDAPFYRITRTNLWKEEINPWRDKEKLPVLRGGLLGELLYGDEPRIIDDLQVDRADPAAAYFAGQRSLIAIPLYDQGRALNMVVQMRTVPFGFDRNQFPEWVWISNLFGRATHNLVLSEELQRAYHAVDHEMKVIENLQRSLLPAELPQIPTLDLAVHYKTSHRAGGDYYDFFPLQDGKLGIWIADVSGHGSPAAVLMAITHSIAHISPDPPITPRRMLNHVNYHLTTRYTVTAGTFVTAFYGIYDPAQRKLTYACAGHNPPRLKHCDDGSLSSLDSVQSLPLGISTDEEYTESVQMLRPGDQLVFYTDGVTEAANPSGEMFGVARLDHVLAECPHTASALLEAVLEQLEHFTAGRPPADDQTMIIARIS
jgi:sigma-B regulation protein RsbU (phosphoserine phosphatase)